MVEPLPLSARTQPRQRGPRQSPVGGATEPQVDIAESARETQRSHVRQPLARRSQRVQAGRHLKRFCVTLRVLCTSRSIVAKSASGPRTSIFDATFERRSARWIAATRARPKLCATLCGSAPCHFLHLPRSAPSQRTHLRQPMGGVTPLPLSMATATAAEAAMRRVRDILLSRGDRCDWEWGECEALRINGDDESP